MIDYGKARETMQKCIDEFFDKDGFNIKVGLNGDKIWITNTEDEYSTGRSMLMCSIFERIFILTGFYPCAFTQSLDINKKNYLLVYMHHKNAFEHVDKDGTYWENTSYRAECPKCGEKKKFEFMRYYPKDCRTMTCPVCSYSGSVKSFWESVKL